MADNVTLPVTGTGTADVSVATDDVASVHYPYVKLADGTLGSTEKIGGDAANGLDVDVTRSALPSGAATAAKQDTIIGHLDGVEGSLATVAGAVSGTEMQADVLTVPADPFGANADAASPTGSISAKLRASATALEIIDDWDESDRAKVNPIAGQSGVQGGAGAVSANTQRVAIATDANAVTVSGVATLAEQQSQTTHLATIAGDTTDIETAVELIDDAIKADDAGFTAATDKVMMQGALTVAIGSDPDAADAADAGAPIMNRHRVQFVIGGHPNVLTLKHTTITTAVTDAAIITVGAGNKICVTRITVTLDNASTVFPTVIIGFGAANTPTTTGVIASHGGVPAGGGFTIGDGSGVIGQGADGEDLRVTTTGNATGNGLQITVTYFILPS